MGLVHIKKPWDFKLRAFPVSREKVLYSSDEYAMAISNYEGSSEYRLGMRWQEERRQKPHGFPNRARTPLWMMVPCELAIPILTHILSNKEENKDEVDYARIIDAISKLKQV